MNLSMYIYKNLIFIFPFGFTASGSITSYLLYSNFIILSGYFTY